MDSIFVKFLKHLRDNSTEDTSNADFLALVNHTLHSGIFLVPRSETSTKIRECPALPSKILVQQPYFFGRLFRFNTFFNKISSVKHEGICCLDFYGNNEVKQALENMFSQAGITLNFCCSNFMEHSLPHILSVDRLYDKQSSQHNMYVNENSYPYIDFLREGIIEYSNGTYDTMIKDFLENIDLLHTNSHKFIAFIYMYRTGVVMRINEDNSNLILMTTHYFNMNY